MININEEFIGPPAPKIVDTAMNRQFSQVALALREGTTIASLIRLSGAGLIILSLSLFLMQGMQATSDLHRYLLLLGETVLLTGAGFAVGYVLKEPKGARIFFSLALVSIPANFAVLGAMIYSIAPFDSVIADYPSYATWKSAHINELLVAGIAGFVVLIPMSVFCFAVLARHSKWWLSGAYLLASATLLIPLRESFSVTLISSACVVAVLILLSNRKAQRQRLSTGEEQFAKTLLFLPVILMLARSFMLYDVDVYAALAILATVYYLLRSWVIARTQRTALTTILQTLTVFCSFMLSGMVSYLFSDTFSFVPPILVFALVWLALNMEITRFIDNFNVQCVIHRTWGYLCIGAMALNLVLFSHSMGVVYDLTLASIVLIAGIVTRQKIVSVLGVIGLLSVVVVKGSYVFTVMLNAGWASIAIAGVLAIIFGSLLERFWPVLKIKLQSRFNHQNTGKPYPDELEQQEELSVERQSIAA